MYGGCRVTAARQRPDTGAKLLERLRSALLATAPMPSPPVRNFSFTDWQVNHPTEPPPGDALDSNFDATNLAVGQQLSWCSISLNSDGTLRDGIVGAENLVPGLFDNISSDIIADVQPLVDAAESYAASALGSANEAQLSEVNAENQASAAAAAAVSATAAKNAAYGSQSAAAASAATATNRAVDADNSANHALGSENQAYLYTRLAGEWAEHMPDTIPPDALAVMAITGDHWSSRWWANRAASAFGLLAWYYCGAGPIPPTQTLNGDPVPVGGMWFDTTTNTMMVWNGSAWQPFAAKPQKAFTSSLYYAAAAGQSVFPLGTSDLFGSSYDIDPDDPEGIEACINGVRLTPDPNPAMSVGDYYVDAAASSVIFARALPAGAMVAIDVLQSASTLAPNKVRVVPIQNINTPPGTQNGTTTGFTLRLKADPLQSPVMGAAEELVVSVDGVIQEPGVQFVVAGSQIHFTNAPSADSYVFILWYGPP